MKYIRFYVTLGGDTGWRFTNQDEWHAMKNPIFFDADKWTMEKVKEVMDRVDYDIYHGSNSPCRKGPWSTLSDKGNGGATVLRPFIEKADGVYVLNPVLLKNGDKCSRAPWGCSSIPGKGIDDPAPEDIIDWNLNGKSGNYHNQFEK